MTNEKFNEEIIAKYLKENADYISNYQKDNLRDKQEFVQRVSAYNWLSKNQKYIHDSMDFERNLKVSRILLSGIKRIATTGEDIDTLKANINKYVEEFKSNVYDVYYDFDISNCLSLDDIISKIRHNEEFFTLLSESIRRQQAEQQLNENSQEEYYMSW